MICIITHDRCYSTITTLNRSIPVTILLAEEKPFRGLQTPSSHLAHGGHFHPAGSTACSPRRVPAEAAAPYHNLGAMSPGGKTEIDDIKQKLRMLNEKRLKGELSGQECEKLKDQLLDEKGF